MSGGRMAIFSLSLVSVMIVIHLGVSGRIRVSAVVVIIVPGPPVSKSIACELWQCKPVALAMAGGTPVMPSALSTL